MNGLHTQAAVERGSRARWLRGRLGLAECLRAILKKDGYDVSIVQNPTTSLADDVAVTQRAIAAAQATGHPGRPLLRRRRDHRSRQRSQGRRPRLHRGLRAGQRRVGRRP